MALRKRGVTFLTCFRKRGVPRKGRFPQKRREGVCVSNTAGNYANFAEFWRGNFVLSHVFIYIDVFYDLG